MTAPGSLDYGIVTMPTASDGIVPADFVTLASGQRVVVCRTTVQRGTLRMRVTLFLPQPGELAPRGRDLDAVLERDPGLGVPARLEASGTGEATVVAPAADAASTELVAMAAAVCAASWGWDESAIIRVSVNDASFLVESRHAGVGEQWHVAIVGPTEARVQSRDAEQPG